MNPREPEQDQDAIISVYLIVNGALGMTAGKIASQAFQVCQRLLRAADDPSFDTEVRTMIHAWEQQGTRTICRVAETEQVFERVCNEAPGITLIDEGVFGCEPDSKTIHAVFPCRRDQTPKIIRHKRCQLLMTPTTKGDLVLA